MSQFSVPLIEPPIQRAASEVDPSVFAQAWAETLGVPLAIPFDSAVAAYHAVFSAYGLKAGDRVLLSPGCSSAAVTAIVQAGLQPVLREPDPYTLLLDLPAQETAPWQGVGAVIVTHLWGRPAPLEPMVANARKFGVPLIEDAVHAHGAQYRGRLVGSLGDAAVFCFGPGRVLGDAAGGAIVTLTDVHAAGRFSPGRSPFSRAAAGRLLRQLENFEAILRAREATAQAYRDSLGNIEGLRVALPERQGRHVYYRFVIRVPEAVRVRKALEHKGIECGAPHFALADASPVIRAAADEILFLPMALSQGRAAIDLVSEAMRSAMTGVRVNARE